MGFEDFVALDGAGANTGWFIFDLRKKMTVSEANLIELARENKYVFYNYRDDGIHFRQNAVIPVID